MSTVSLVCGTPLNESQLATLREVREWVSDQSRSDSAFSAHVSTGWLNDTCLRRYLVANRWKLEVVKKAISDSLAWRLSLGIPALTAASFAFEKAPTSTTGTRLLDAVPAGASFSIPRTSPLSRMYGYWNGFDARGRPILYQRMRRHDTSLPRPLRVSFFLYLFEVGCRLMAIGPLALAEALLSHPRTAHLAAAGAAWFHPGACASAASASAAADPSSPEADATSTKDSAMAEPKWAQCGAAEQWLIVMDEKGKQSKNNDFKFLKALADPMFRHYVERLAVVFVLAPSLTFSVGYKIASAFIDDRTKAKVRLVDKVSSLPAKWVQPLSAAGVPAPPPPPAATMGEPAGKYQYQTPAPLAAEVDATYLEVDFGGALAPPTPEDFALVCLTIDAIAAARGWAFGRAGSVEGLGDMGGDGSEE
eukprot:TRINITY_DN3276_c0_g1_i1.p1 TRINITY_DN3276_c0_g1~~TRINITY_DN3276_c0_g1_i1.p1  ORF type:complete len:420 (-),score=57.29 TRINITY_DN3276_c0_g1_i1:246-1505(-)